jgi:hypothetical protein
LEDLFDFLAAVTCPFDSLLYCFGLDARLLGYVANFMSLPSGNQLTVTTAAAAFLGTSCHTHFLLGRLAIPNDTMAQAVDNLKPVSRTGYLRGLGTLGLHRSFDSEFEA